MKSNILIGIATLAVIVAISGCTTLPFASFASFDDNSQTYDIAYSAWQCSSNVKIDSNGASCKPEWSDLHGIPGIAESYSLNYWEKMDQRKYGLYTYGYPPQVLNLMNAESYLADRDLACSMRFMIKKCVDGSGSCGVNTEASVIGEAEAIAVPSDTDWSYPGGHTMLACTPDIYQGYNGISEIDIIQVKWTFTGDEPVEEYCGDGICNGPESSSDCPEDCPVTVHPEPEPEPIPVPQPVTDPFQAIINTINWLIDWLNSLLAGM